LKEQDVDVAGVLSDSNRVTTVKERFMGRAANRHPHQILRVDREQTHSLDEPLQVIAIADVVKRIKQFDAVLISDYAKGVCTAELIATAISAATKANLPVLVDPARLNDYSNYRGASIVTPNRAETELVSGLKIASVEQAIDAGQKLCQQYDIGAAVVTLDQDGMVLVTGDESQVFPTRPRRVYDITGAGDTVLAALGLGQAAGLSLPDSIQIANVAAGLEVEQVGVVPIPRADIENELTGQTGATQSKLVTVDEAAEATENARRRGQSVVFTNGCFDLLHVGHVTYLQEAAALGDMLIIGMNSDDSIRRLKGESRPVINEQNRAALLAALQCVDFVVVFDEDTPCDLLEKIRPDTLVKGGTYSPDEVVGKDIVESYGGTVCVTSVSVNVSTTKIVEKIRQQDNENQQDKAE